MNISKRFDLTFTLLIFCAATLLLTSPAGTAEIKAYKILFGSCLHQDKVQPIWQAMHKEQADLLVLLGDNVYGDTEDMQLLTDKYAKQWQKTGMKKMLASMPLVGIWDDHDYGENDAGLEYPQKEASRQIMLDYFNEPKDSPRRTRKDGIYTSYMFGEPDMRIQLILPDLRWNRTKLNSVGKLAYMADKAPKKMGPYETNQDPTATMLGESQWQWLELQLQQPAQVRILASSLQLLPEFTGWESWANFPNDRQRFLTLLDKYQINNLVIVSGDTHWSEMSRVQRQNGLTLWEMTASGLTEEWKQVSPNKHRVGRSYSKANYGMLEIQYAQLDYVTMTIKDVNGNLVMQRKVKMVN